MLGAMLLGLPLAALTARYVIRGRQLLATLAVLALVSPPFIGAYAWIMMLGRNGFVRTTLEEIGIELPSLYGYLGIILVFSLKFYPFVFLLASSSLRTINPSVEEAARAWRRPWRRFFAVTLPLVFPAVSAGALLTFVLSVADFGTPAIVGGNVRVLATTAYNLFTSEMAAIQGVASATSIVLIVLSLGVVALQRAAVRKRKRCGKPHPHSRRRGSSGRCRRSLRTSSATRSCSRAACPRSSSFTRRSGRPADPSSSRVTGSTAMPGSCARFHRSSATARSIR
jgi:iron(III) transport system permease protein